MSKLELGKNDKRITIITGHYGSGKTEVAINYAMRVKEKFDKVALVDLDIVNPYFRSRETKQQMEEKGIQVVASVEPYFNTDLPAISPAIMGVFQNQALRAVIDLGGDETGARAMGRFSKQINKEEYEMFFVVNPFRPFTATKEGIYSIISKIEAVSGLKVSAMVSNPNLLTKTYFDDILAGHRIVEIAAEEKGLPIRFLSLVTSPSNQSAIDQLENSIRGIPVLILERYMLAPWEELN